MDRLVRHRQTKGAATARPCPTESAPALYPTGCLCVDQTALGFGLPVDGVVQWRPVADLCHPDFLCGVGDGLSPGRPGAGRTPGADLGGDGVSCILSLQPCRAARRE